MTGKIGDARAIWDSERFRALSEFTKIYTVGPFTARHYYDDLGLRDMEDLIAYSERLPDEEPSARNLEIALAFKDDFAKQLRHLMALPAFHLSLHTPPEFLAWRLKPSLKLSNAILTRSLPDVSIPSAEGKL
jgi:hypothetical protein